MNEGLTQAIGLVCGRIQSLTDFLWAFPTQYGWYADIPVLGHIPAAVLILVGSGIWFTLRLRFIQVRKFREGIRLIAHGRKGGRGISPLASFMLSTAMRIGPGNIVGVTGAISVGGPGALFWMWVSAFFGMATAFVESTLAQIFKERKGNDYYGGFAHYGRKLMNDSATVGMVLSFIYISYSLLCLPAQGFNTISSIGQVVGIFSDSQPSQCSPLFMVSSIALVVFLTVVAFRGVKGVTRVTNAVVPVMSVLFAVTVITLVALNLDSIPFFFSSVFEGAFNPEAIFGGSVGTCVAQGIKRGLMSNEAGQGTITMAAAASEVEHPCEQGCIQSIGVFLDTMVVATLSAFVVIMGHMWTRDTEWIGLGKLDKFVASVNELSPWGILDQISQVSVAVCFGLFAFSCLIGFIALTEIAATRVSTRRLFINSVRIACISFISFGLVTEMVGMDLSSLWNLSDLANLMMVAVNLPLLCMGFRYVRRAERGFGQGSHASFHGIDVGLRLDAWDEDDGNHVQL